MADAYYPALDDKFCITLKLLVDAIKVDPELANSPYPLATRGEVLENLKPSTQDVTEAFPLSEEVPENFSETQLIDMIKRLRIMENNALQNDTKMDTNEQIQVMKVNAALLERLLNMRDHAVNIKKMNEFQTVVLSLLDEVLTEDQKGQLVERLSNGDL